MGGGLRACGPRSLKSLFHRLFCALTGQPLEISEESYVLRSRGAEPRRVGIWSHKPSPAGVLGLLKRRLSWRGAVLPHNDLKEKFGSSRLPAGSPAESDCGGGGSGSGGRQHRRRWRSLGDFSSVLFYAEGVGAPE